MDESADARRILTAVPQSEWRRPAGQHYTSWMATLKNDLSRHNLTLEDAIELALDKPLWRLLAASGATHWWCMPNNDDDYDDPCTSYWSVHFLTVCVWMRLLTCFPLSDLQDGLMQCILFIYSWNMSAFYACNVCDSLTSLMYVRLYSSGKQWKWTWMVLESPGKCTMKSVKTHRKLLGVFFFIFFFVAYLSLERSCVHSCVRSILISCLLPGHGKTDYYSVLHRATLKKVN